MTTVAEHYNPIATAIATMPKPVVAAVNGPAMRRGRGLRLRGGLPDRGGHGVVQHVVRRGGALRGLGDVLDAVPAGRSYGKAADLLLFPRSVPADEALALGLVHRVVPTAELAGEALGVARRLAAGPTVAYAAIKESLAFGAEHSLVATLGKEDELQARAGGSEDHRIAVDAFLRKEAPRYVGR